MVAIGALPKTKQNKKDDFPTCYSLFFFFFLHLSPFGSLP